MDMVVPSKLGLAGGGCHGPVPARAGRAVSGRWPRDGRFGGLGTGLSVKQSQSSGGQMIANSLSRIGLWQILRTLLLEKQTQSAGPRVFRSRVVGHAGAARGIHRGAPPGSQLGAQCAKQTQSSGFWPENAGWREEQSRFGADGPGRPGFGALTRGWFWPQSGCLARTVRTRGVDDDSVKEYR